MFMKTRIGVMMLHQASYIIWEILKFTFAENFKKEVIRKVVSVEKKSEIENWLLGPGVVLAQFKSSFC